MTDLLQAQYDDIKSARQALLNYCTSISNAHLFKPAEAMNNNSIISLLVHNANTYKHWLYYFDLETTGPYFKEPEVTNVKDIEAIYAQIDVIVVDFLGRHQQNYLQGFTKKLPGKDRLVTTTPLQLFTHAITHEFHHKGQILHISRLLDYVPVDTDVIRT